jgi:hypothetical protein
MAARIKALRGKAFDFQVLKPAFLVNLSAKSSFPAQKRWVAPTQPQQNAGADVTISHYLTMDMTKGKHIMV